MTTQPSPPVVADVAIATSAAGAGSRRWWHDAIVYECHLPCLRDGNGDGIGDLEGLIESLDYLSGELGIDAIWTGPFYRSPLLDQGFDVAGHTEVEPVFGTLETFDRLITEAHARGMKVIVDYIPNHTSDQHPWFVESRSSRENPKRDWYIWADARPGERYPNNWTSEAGGSVWDHDERTGQFYLHSHLPEQPDLNWRNPDVRAAMHDVLRFWLDRGVDGFRVDVAHMLMKDPELRDNPPNPGAEANPWDLQHPDFDGQLHVNDRMHPDLDDVLREIRGVLDEYGPDRVAIGEVPAMAWHEWARFFGGDLDAIHLPFGFKLIETPWDARELARTLVELDAALPDGAWPILALSNHDRPRLATRLGRHQARAAALLLLTVRGTPTLFYGDELGMCDQDVPRERQRDYFGLTDGGVSRDPARTPMPWNDGPNGGFSTARPGQLWLPVCHEYETINIEAQRADDNSMLVLYRRLIELRRSSPALRGGTFALHPASDHQCLVYTRTSGDDHKLVALNLGDEPVTLSDLAPGTIAAATDAARNGERLAGSLHLAPGEGAVMDVAR